MGFSIVGQQQISMLPIRVLQPSITYTNPSSSEVDFTNLPDIMFPQFTVPSGKKLVLKSIFIPMIEFNTIRISNLSYLPTYEIHLNLNDIRYWRIATGSINTGTTSHVQYTLFLNIRETIEIAMESNDSVTISLRLRSTGGYPTYLSGNGRITMYGWLSGWIT